MLPGAFFRAITGIRMLRIHNIAVLFLCGACVLCAGPADTDPDLEKRLRETVEQMAGVGSRVTGYPGCDSAGVRLEAALREAGVEVIQEHRFSLPVPILHAVSA